jgi:predicted nucleic acid-binding protein
MKRYAGANLGFVDASVAATAERLKIAMLLTTDRRHFSIIMPAHCERFNLVP